MRLAPIIVIAITGVAFAQVPDDLVQLPVHQRALETHRDTPTSPDLIGPRDAVLIPLQTRDLPSHPCATVFGYLPYWESAANLRYEHLTHIACFSVEVNSNGTLGDDHGWPWTSLINDAHANGVKVVLVATLFSNSGINTLINNSTYKNNFFVNMKNKMLEGTADGINIDFEPGGSGSLDWQSQIHTFMAELTAYMHAEVPGSEVTIAGPAVNWSSRWDLAAVADGCDGIFIMGYAFAGSWSSSTWANAPLEGGSYDITNTVLTQYGDVTQNHPEKLILGVPYYGNEWKTTSSDPHATVSSYVSSTRFRDDEPDSQTYGLLWDTVTQTPWYRRWDGSYWRQVWFDNATSLGLKYDLALDNNLQGVGMWALNYDGTRDELWDLLATKIGGCVSYGDFDGDGDADSDDWPFFVFCLGGPEDTYSDGHICLPGDADEDLDVDITDFSMFQEVCLP